MHSYNLVVPKEIVDSSSLPKYLVPSTNNVQIDVQYSALEYHSLKVFIVLFCCVEIIKRQYEKMLKIMRNVGLVRNYPLVYLCNGGCIYIDHRRYR